MGQATVAASTGPAGTPPSGVAAWSSPFCDSAPSGHAAVAILTTNLYSCPSTSGADVQ